MYRTEKAEAARISTLGTNKKKAVRKKNSDSLPVNKVSGMPKPY